MRKRKLSVRQAYLLGQLIVNGGVILIMAGIWILSFVVVAQAKLSVWFILLGIFAGPLVAWVWWSFSIPRWRDFASHDLDDDEMEELHQAAIQGQLEWPRGHVFSETEIKTQKQKLQELDTAISDTENFLGDYLDPRELEYFQERGVDTKAVEDIRVFIKNLRYRIDTSGHTVDFHSDGQSIDDFIERLKSTNRSLEKTDLRPAERRDWYGPTSALIKQLVKIKKVLRAIR